MIYVMMAESGIEWVAIVSIPFATMSQKVDQSKIGLYMGVFNLSVVLPQVGARCGIGEATRASPNKSLNFFIYTGTLLCSGLTSMFVKE